MNTDRKQVPTWRRYLRLVGRDERADVEDELAFHLQAKRDELVRRGVPPERAMEEARRGFGDVAEVRDRCVRIERGRVRKMEWRERLGIWRQDLKYALRQLRRSPGFTATAVLSLALGIGANSAIFTLTDQILLRMLPVENPRELTQLAVNGGRVGSQSGDGVHTFSHPMFLAFRERNTVFRGLTGQATENAGMTVGDRNQLVNVALVAGNYFDVFGVKAHRGRLLTPEDDRVKMGAAVAVLRHEFWRSQFGADLAAVGSTIRLNGRPFTVIGIAAPGFDGTDVGDPVNVWIPVTMKPALVPVNDRLEDSQFSWFYLFGRLKPGVTLAQAEAEMKVLFRQRQEEELRLPFFENRPHRREEYLRQTFQLEPAARGQSGLRSRFAAPLVVLECVVGAVLLIACSNIAGLLLARGAARQREIAIRTALGAGRGALIRQLMAESLLLALVSGAVGILVSAWATRALVGMVMGEAALAGIETAPDLRVLLFAIGLTLLTTLAFGLLPAWQASRPAAATLKESAGAIAGSGGQVRMRKFFVAFQVGLSTMLLIGAGLFVRTLGNLRAIDLGFETETVATFLVRPASAYDDAKRLRVFRQVVESVAGVPGVKAAGANTTALLTGGISDGSIRLPGVEPQGDTLDVLFNNITPGYFEALGMKIKAGRDLTWREWGGPRKYCLVNETLAKKYFAGRSPIGTLLGRGSQGGPEYEIVGVFADARYEDPRGSVSPQTFFAVDGRIQYLTGINVYARVQGDARAVIPQLREQVRRVDPNLLVSGMTTLDGQLDRKLANERMLAILSAGFAVLAALLAATGLYGVLSFLVARRSREIGIRMALGARRSAVVQLVLSEMTAACLGGLVAGAAGAIVGFRVVESQLYGVKPSDPGVFGASLGALLACSLLAAAIPAWRASRLDPTVALRQD